MRVPGLDVGLRALVATCSEGSKDKEASGRFLGHFVGLLSGVLAAPRRLNSDSVASLALESNLLASPGISWAGF